MLPLQWWAESAPLGCNRVKVSQNLGATAVASVAPVDTSQYVISSLHFSLVKEIDGLNRYFIIYSIRTYNEFKVKIILRHLYVVILVLLNTSYLTDSYIVFTLKMKSIPKTTIFGLK